MDEQKNNSITSAKFTEKDVSPLFERCLLSVREEIRDNSYIQEAISVLPVGGYRSSIGAFWNAVVDDLRNKIMYRSLSLFNKEVKSLKREIKTYEDFQNYVNDDELIEGAYNIGVIGWEASKILKHAKETRHIFSGHPKSSPPSIIKVLAMMDDCVKYVLNDEYPSKIIDIDEFITTLDKTDFDRNKIAIENALGELPETYKNELAQRLYTAYVHPVSSTDLRSNIEFVMPVLWRVLPKEVRINIVRRVDQEIAKTNIVSTQQAFAFVILVNAKSYLSVTARKYKVQPLIEKLKASLGNFPAENELVRDLSDYSSIIPQDLLSEYIEAITLSYVGFIGYSSQFSRTDFFANGAAFYIPNMFESFDDRAAEIFVTVVKTNMKLRERIKSPMKLRRLRFLANIVHNKVSDTFTDNKFLELLIDETQEEKFLKAI